MSDEEVIKRRLIFDGDGTGDDRRLNLMIKMISKWINSRDESPLENQAIYDKILAQLALCQHSRKRSQLLTKTNDKQLRKYQELYLDYERKISEIKNEIAKQKEEFEKAKVIKQNRIQYDLLASTIGEEPARTETKKKLESLQGELKELCEDKNRLDQKLNKRRKQFHVLSTSANQIAMMLKEEKQAEEDAGMNTSLDDITNSPGPEPMSE